MGSASRRCMRLRVFLGESLRLPMGSVGSLSLKCACAHHAPLYMQALQHRRHLLRRHARVGCTRVRSAWCRAGGRAAVIEAPRRRGVVAARCNPRPVGWSHTRIVLHIPHQLVSQGCESTCCTSTGCTTKLAGAGRRTYYRLPSQAPPTRHGGCSQAAATRRHAVRLKYRLVSG